MASERMQLKLAGTSDHMVISIKIKQQIIRGKLRLCEACYITIVSIGLPVILVKSWESLLTDLLDALGLSGNALCPLFTGSQLIVLDVIGEDTLKFVKVGTEFQDLLVPEPELGLQLSDPGLLLLKEARLGHDHRGGAVLEGRRRVFFVFSKALGREAECLEAHAHRALC